MAALSLSLLVALTLLFPLSSSPAADTFVYGGCTQQLYAPGSPYESNLNSLLSSLANSATFSAYGNLTVLAPSRSDVVYGLYQCRGDLAMPACASCVARALARAGGICPAACGAAVQLDGCFVKYDNATFVGAEDKAVVLRRCGPPSGGRGPPDEALMGLAGSGGYYRAGGSGRVRGVAQCSGDLSLGGCQDCVGEAVRRLRTDCGGADYGDVFLGKCYARFSAGGAHGYYSDKPHGKSDNEGQKTFAIIIGLLAGVAILIIFLAFLRRICEGHGK